MISTENIFWDLMQEGYVSNSSGVPPFQTISRFFIRLIAAMQQRTVTIMIHPRCSNITGVTAARVNILVIATRWVSGSRASARYWSAGGRSVSGKNVPEKSVIGVMKRNAG